MSNENQQTPDPRIVEKLLENFWHDGDLEVRRQEIDMQRARLIAQRDEAEERGDTRLCEEIERRMRELLKTRQELG